jgi:hypothetical protein
MYTWVSDVGKERAKVVGPSTMSDSEGWTRVGELGLNKLALKPDPQRITFGELATQYLDQYPFNKLSTRELHAQIIKRRLLSKWRDAVAVEIKPRKLKAWFNGFDVESTTRGKYKSAMSGVYKWGQDEELLPRANSTTRASTSEEGISRRYLPMRRWLLSRRIFFRCSANCPARCMRLRCW